MLMSALLLLQAAGAACPATPAPVPAELRGWTPARSLTAGAATPVAIVVGKGVRATLLPAATVRLAAPTTRPQPAGSHAGLFAFAVPSAGRYRVALDTRVWVDVIAAGKALPAAAHGHGTPCSPIRKMVDFDLQPGRYIVQVVGSTAPTLGLMVTSARPEIGSGH